MNTLAQAALLTNDKMLSGVLDTIVKESPLLARLGFRNFVGNNWDFNIENAMAGVGWYSSGDTWVESTGTWAQGQVSIKTMGGDVDTDIFSAKTKGDFTDLQALNIEAKAKAMAHEFERAFIYGGTTTVPDAKEFKGILKWIANYETSALTTADLDGLTNDQVIPNHATSAVLALSSMDKMIDAVRPGKPDFIMTDRAMRRYLSSLARTSSSSPIRYGQDQFGAFVQWYNEIPVIINDFMNDNMRDNDGSSVLAIASYVTATTRAATVDNSLILAMKLDETNGVCGIQNGNMQHYPIGELETKRAYRNRFAWDCAVVMLGKKCAAVITGATDA